MILPYHRQETDYTCGPAAMRAALLFHGVSVPESILSRWCGSSEKDGTHEDEMLRVMRLFYPKSHAKRRFGIRGLQDALKHDHPCIVLIGTHKPWSHYLCVEEVHAKSVYVLDPWDGRHTMLERREFNARWDKENRWGMACVP